MRLSILAAILITTPLLAQNLDTRPTLETKRYETMQEAAVHGLQQSYILADMFEAGGLIYQNKKDHTYAISFPVVSKSGRQLVIPMLEWMEGYGRPVADYHTHPCNPNLYSKYFSEADTYGNAHFRDVGFIADLCNGNVHEFDPARDNPHVTELKGYDWHGNEVTEIDTEGRIVGHFNVNPPPPMDYFKAIQEPTDPQSPDRYKQQLAQHPLVDAKNFDTEQDAALYALHNSRLLSHNVEYGGVILQNIKDHQYYTTIPITDHKTGSVHLPVLIHDYDGTYVMVAMYHTHAACTNHNYIHGFFSAPDAAEGKYFKLNSYMLNVCTGNMYLFDYRVDKADDYSPKELPGLVMTRGRLVGWLP